MEVSIFTDGRSPERIRLSLTFQTTAHNSHRPRHIPEETLEKQIQHPWHGQPGLSLAPALRHPKVCGICVRSLGSHCQGGWGHTWIPKRKTATFYEVRIACTTKTHITQMSVWSSLGILGLGRGKKRAELTSPLNLTGILPTRSSSTSTRPL